MHTPLIFSVAICKGILLLLLNGEHSKQYRLLHKFLGLPSMMTYIENGLAHFRHTIALLYSQSSSIVPFRLATIANWLPWVDSNYRPHPYQGCAMDQTMLQGKTWSRGGAVTRCGVSKNPAYFGAPGGIRTPEMSGCKPDVLNHLTTGAQLISAGSELGTLATKFGHSPGPHVWTRAAKFEMAVMTGFEPVMSS